MEKRLALQGQKHYPGVIQPVYSRYGKQGYFRFCTNLVVMTMIFRTASSGCECHEYASPMKQIFNI